MPGVGERYTVLGLPYRRTRDELGESPFIKMLNAEELSKLSVWLNECVVTDVWFTSWQDEDAHWHRIFVQRVA